MKHLLEILPDKEISFQMPDEVFTVFYDLIKKTMAIHAPMSFYQIYKNLPVELQGKITVKEVERNENDVRGFELINLYRDELREDGE